VSYYPKVFACTFYKGIRTFQRDRFDADSSRHRPFRCKSIKSAAFQL